MGARGPKPAEIPGETIGAHVDGVTLIDLRDVVHTRNRSQSFIAAEAIRLGLAAVKELYPAVRKSRLKSGSKKPPASASKKGSAKAGAKKKRAASAVPE